MLSSTFNSKLLLLLKRIICFSSIFFIGIFIAAKPVSAGMIGTHVGEFDLGSQIHILQMIKSKNVPANYPVTIVVEMYKSREEIQSLANETSGLKPTVRIAKIESETTADQIVALAQNLNGVTWPQGSKPIIVFGNEMNNLDADREWGPNPPPATESLTPIQNAGKIYSGFFKIFNDALDNSYPLAAQPPDMYNGNTAYDWSSFVSKASISYKDASAMVANVYNIEPGKLERWKLLSNQYPKQVTFFTEYGPSPSDSLQAHLDFFRTNPPPSGIDATTLIPNKCGAGSSSWLWYINGTIYDFDGGKIDPKSCTSSTTGTYVLRDPATLLKQESVGSAFESLFSNYTLACAPFFQVDAKVKNDKAKAIIDGEETTLYTKCLGNNETRCILDNATGTLQTDLEAAKVPYYSEDIVSSRSSGFDGFYTYEAPDGSQINTGPFQKLITPYDQCVYQISVLRAASQICNTPPAESYQTLVTSANGTTQVQGISTGDGCPLDASIRASGQKKQMLEMFDEIKDLRDQYPNDNFRSVEDFCKVSSLDPNSIDGQRSPTLVKVQELAPFVNKVKPFRNVYEVGYLVYAEDFIPPPENPIGVIFPFLQLNKDRDVIPLKVGTILFPFGLSTIKDVETKEGSLPHDYLTGALPILYNSMKNPEEIEQNNVAYKEEIKQLQTSFPQGFPEVEDETSCTDYICCPKCKQLIETLGNNPGFNEDLFKSMLGVFINKGIAANSPSNMTTEIGTAGKNNLSGAFQYCRVSQDAIKGEVVKNLGSSATQTVYQAITNILVSIFGTIKVAGPKSEATDIRVFLITPDESRSLRLEEGTLASRNLNPDYIDWVNKQIEKSDKQPILQMSKNSYSSSSQESDSISFPKPPGSAEPNPSASPTATPQVEISGEINTTGGQMNTGAGAITAGGMHVRELFEWLSHILGNPDGPNYAEKYDQTSLEELWKGHTPSTTGTNL